MLFFGRTPHNIRFFFFLLLILFIPQAALGVQKENHFPYYKAIEKNVIFWEKVYSEWSKNTAVLHDKNDLSIIYETIPLLDRSLPAARRLNEKYIKASKKKYSHILTKLSKGVQPRTALERRVYNLFSPPNLRTKFRIAAQNLRSQTGLREQFREGVIRSGGYMAEMKRIFRSYQLPEDLAYLPHVESSFNINAYSKYGAAGAWQFTRSTGKLFMTINYTIDERRDPIIATHAAAKYLKQNYTNLGSWPLALTAYNYGHAGMMRAAKKHGNYVNIFHRYREGHFKFASRNFYSEFVAARRAAKRIENSAGIQLDRPKPYFTSKLRGYASVQKVSQYFGISLSTLKKYNPSLQKPIWSGEKYIPKGYRLKLPETKKNRQLAKYIPDSVLKRGQKRSQFYTIKRGDTAGKVARRHGVSLRDLMRINRLDKKASVYIGQKLRIPYGKKSVVTNSKKRHNQIPSTKVRVPVLKGSKKGSKKTARTAATPQSASPLSSS